MSLSLVPAFDTNTPHIKAEADEINARITRQKR